MQRAAGLSKAKRAPQNEHQARAASKKERRKQHASTKSASGSLQHGALRLLARAVLPVCAVGLIYLGWSGRLLENFAFARSRLESWAISSPAGDRRSSPDDVRAGSMGLAGLEVSPPGGEPKAERSASSRHRHAKVRLEQLSEEHAKRCEQNDFHVAQSTQREAGNGVFADTEIASGRACCYYDGVDYPPGEDVSDPESNYVMTGPEGWVREGYVPVRSKCGVVQMANDGSAGVLLDEWWPEVDRPTSLSRSMKAVKSYAADSIKQNNIVNMPGKPYMYLATRQISPGDEIFLSYGVNFWRGRAIAKGNPTLKLMLKMLQDMLLDPQKPHLLATINTLPYFYNASRKKFVTPGGKPLNQKTAINFLRGIGMMEFDAANALETLSSMVDRIATDYEVSTQ